MHDDSKSKRGARPQELLLIRHATTDMAGTLCGQSDPPLNALGREQAEALAQLIRACALPRLYTSDLRRALETAEPVGTAWGVPVTVRAELREIYFGQWEGKRWSRIRCEMPDMRAIESCPEFCAPGGEPFACFRKRVVRALNQILGECDGVPAALVTHLGVISTILQLSPAQTISVPQQRVEYCSVHRVRLSGPLKAEGSGELLFNKAL